MWAFDIPREIEDSLIQQVGQPAKEPAKEPVADEPAKPKRTRTKTVVKIEDDTVNDDDVHYTACHLAYASNPLIGLCRVTRTLLRWEEVDRSYRYS